MNELTKIKPASGLYPPGLYLVATPIGNLKDITLRALEVLQAADLILCEDTRVTGALLSAYDIKTPTSSYHDHTSDAKRHDILRRLGEGQVIALVSDAGTPLISDPGFKLVQDARKDNIPVTSLPGANAPLTALQLSGLPVDRFTFIGFLPAKEAAKKQELKKWENSPATLMFYEGKQRLMKTLKTCYEIFGARQACVARELTKKFEEVITAPLDELIAELEGRDSLKGEFVVLIAPPSAEDLYVSDAALETKIRQGMEEGGHIKTLSAQLAEETGRMKKEIYELALKIKNEAR